MRIGRGGLVAIALGWFVVFPADGSGGASRAHAAPAPNSQATPKPIAAPARGADVATLLFEQPMWHRAGPGSVLRYTFVRRVRGVSFDDDITVELRAGEDPESRTSEVKMFSGSHATAAGPFYSTNVNPVLALVLEQNVQELGRLTGTFPGDLRDAIRKAWRDDAKIADASIDVRGRRVPGIRITVAPFGGASLKARLHGFDRLVYTVEIADGVPGRIAGIDIRTPGNDKPAFRETLRYADGRIR